MRKRFEALLFLLCGSLAAIAVPAAPTAATAARPQVAATAAATSVSPLTADQLIEILDETVDWYRTLGLQQQSATQPSDLLLLYANRQTADNVVRLAFQIARANAELLSSDANAAPPEVTTSRSPQALEQLEQTTLEK